jgi:hypothetical protein
MKRAINTMEKKKREEEWLKRWREREREREREYRWMG